MSTAAKLAAKAKTASSAASSTVSAAAPKTAPPTVSSDASSDASKAASSAVHPAAPVATPVAPTKTANQCREFMESGNPCSRRKCWNADCRKAKANQHTASQKHSAPPKAAGGGDGGISANIAAMEKRLNERLDTIETQLLSGFAAQKAADDRLQRAIESMMGGIGGLARTIEGGIASSRSTTALPALPPPETHGSAMRVLPALPAPESSSHLTNFGNVAARLKECPLNNSVKYLIPSFVARHSRTHDPDALACLLLAILSGKKKSDLTKMGEFTRTKVLPLLTQTNLAIFKRFFEELALKCKPDSCVKVNNSRGEEYKQTFHLLGKEDSDLYYLIQILLEEA